MARPKRQQSTQKGTENVRTSNENIETKETEKTEKVSELPPFRGGMNPVAPDKKVIEVKTPKVIEAEPGKLIEAEPGQVNSPKKSEKRGITYDVFVKGKLRSISKIAYETVSKDPNLNVKLPKGSPLAVNLEPKKKPCKDC